ncbi:MAG: hypothetical protein ABF608_00430 [Sporolactobacillus sp.]
MEDPFLLRWLDPFRKLFEKFSVDYPMLRTILKVKLTMDARRAPTLTQYSASRKGKDGNPFFRSLWLYGLVGLTLIPLILGTHYLLEMALFFGIVMFMVMTSMISDFSSVLLDTADRSILWTKPIAPRTLSAAKTLHLFFYLFLITASLVAPAALVSLFVHGPIFAVLLVLNLILIDMFIVVATTLIYLLILRFFDGERLKDLINYVQIILSFVIAIGYQLLSRTVDLSALHHAFHLSWWALVLPPFWFSATFGWLIEGTRVLSVTVFASAALVIPLFAVWLNHQLAPAFSAYVMKLANDGSAPRRRNKRHIERLSRLVCRTAEEQNFFCFAWSSLKNDRTFKLKAYPSLGLSLILPLLFFIPYFNDDGWSTAEATKSCAFFYLYFALLVIPSASALLKYSSAAQGFWIFRTAPTSDLTHLDSAAVKAFLIRLFLPAFLLPALIFLVLFRFTILPDVLIILLAGVLYTLLCYPAMSDGIPPFSQLFTAVQENNSIRALLFFLIIVPFAGAHALLHFLLPSGWLYICAGLLLLPIALVYHSRFRIEK